MQPFTYKEAITYFRMGLATGFVDKQELIAWADREILRNDEVEADIVELSFCGKRPYSEIIWLLGQFEHGSHYPTAFNLIMARADQLWQEGAVTTADTITGLRLLIEELWIEKAAKRQLQALNETLTQCKNQATSHDSLATQLNQFLTPYRSYRALLTPLIG